MPFLIFRSVGASLQDDRLEKTQIVKQSSLALDCKVVSFSQRIYACKQWNSYKWPVIKVPMWAFLLCSQPLIHFPEGGRLMRVELYVAQ